VGCLSVKLFCAALQKLNPRFERDRQGDTVVELEEGQKTMAG